MALYTNNTTPIMASYYNEQNLSTRLVGVSNNSGMGDSIFTSGNNYSSSTKKSSGMTAAQTMTLVANGLSIGLLAANVGIAAKTFSNMFGSSEKVSKPDATENLTKGLDDAMKDYKKTGNVTGLQAQATLAQEQVNSNTSEMGELQKSVNAQDAIITACSNDAGDKEYQDEITKINNTYSEAEKPNNTTDLKSQLTAAEATEKANPKDATAKQAVTQIETQIKTKEEALDKAKTIKKTNTSDAKKQMDARKTTAETNKADLNKQKSTLDAKNIELNAKLENAKKALSDKGIELTNNGTTAPATGETAPTELTDAQKDALLIADGINPSFLRNYTTTNLTNTKEIKLNQVKPTASSIDPQEETDEDEKTDPKKINELVEQQPKASTPDNLSWYQDPEELRKTQKQTTFAFGYNI